MEIYEAGYRSVNPMYSCVPTRAPWIVHIAWDIYTLLRCDAVFFQKDWKQSRGARIEYRVAKLAGKEILLQTEWGKAPQNNVVNNVADNGNLAACAAAIADMSLKELYNNMQKEAMERIEKEARLLQRSNALPTWANKKEMRRIHSIRTLTEFEKEILGIEGECSNNFLSKQPSPMEQRKQSHTEQQPKQRKGETFNG